MKILLYIFLGLIAASSFIFGAESLNNLPSSIQNNFDTTISSFYAPIKASAVWIFWTLAGIQLVITFGMMLLKGELEIGGIMSKLIHYILLFGLFAAFFQNVDWMKAIFNGFTKLATNATGNTSSLDGIVEHIGVMWQTIGDKVEDNGLTGVGNSLILVLLGGVATVVIFVIGGHALMTYGFFIFSIYVGVFFLAFGGLDYSRSWAYNAIVNVIRWGAKWFMMLLVISVTFTILDTAIQTATDDYTGFLKLLAVSLIMYTIISGSNAFIDSYFSGHGGGDNAAGVQLAKTMATAIGGAVAGAIAAGTVGAAKGAAAGIGSVKEANAADGGQDNARKGGSSSVGNFVKSAGAGTAGAFGGAMTGAAKGAFGKANSETGAGTGAAFAKTAMGAGNAVKSMAGMTNKAMGGGAMGAAADAAKSTLDRSGFDMSQLDGSISKDTSTNKN